ncbi:NAD(P)H-hydrate dehydratase [Rhodobacterales bacterium]|nr:NAD(P)H-hydrate dehydratase [Rhodobacterales bacterium]
MSSKVSSNNASASVLLTPEQMGRADQMTIAGGVPGIDLMERAGEAVAEAAAGLVQEKSRILLLCGPGNNGGDGFVAARRLSAMGFEVSVWSLREPSRSRGDALQAFERMSIVHHVILRGDNIAHDMIAELSEADLVVDALFGAGLDRDLAGPVCDLVDAVNGSGVSVLAVDLPSGVNGATGEVCGCAIKSRATITFFRKKPGHMLMPGRSICGSVAVADIGIPDSVLDEIAARSFANGPDLWLDHSPFPEAAGHKYSRGHAVVFGGPMSRTGAARLAAGAALRTGAGLVTLVSPPDAMMVNACHLTAVMLRKLKAVDQIPELLSDQRLNAVLIGPGYGVGDEACAAVAAILSCGRATVLDADALTSFEDMPADLFSAVRASGGSVVLTPHMGEFSRLFPDIRGDRLSAARQAAARSGAVVVLKGADTVIAAPDGRAAINDNAPPFLATAGSGDVLGGIAAGLLAQAVPAFEAACQAVWLHGEAGQQAGAGLIAEDLVPALRPVLQGLCAFREA